MLRLKKAAVLALFVLLLAACQNPPAVITPTPQAESQQAATLPVESTPESGKVTLVGRVISLVNGEPVGNVPVRLADVYREGDDGAYVLDGAFSPGDITDENGNFIIENVDAKEYVIIVGDVFEKYEVITNEEGKPRVGSFPAGDVYEGPVLDVNLTSQ